MGARKSFHSTQSPSGHEQSLQQTESSSMQRCLQVTLCLLACVANSTARSQGFSPRESERRMTVAKGLKSTLFASEPMVRQSTFVKCDDRGRLWTIQYLQYPIPAGLQRKKVDRWSRTEYD